MKTNMMRGLVALILLASLAVFSVTCSSSGGGGDENDNESALGKMDITNAKALVIAQRGLVNAAGVEAHSAIDDSTVLYKLTEDSLLIEVSLFDESGRQVSSETFSPDYMEDIDDDFVFVSFTGGPMPPHYIVQKSTGSAYHMKYNVGRHWDRFGNKPAFYSSANGDAFDGNAYYVSDDGMLRCVELKGAGGIVDRRVSPEWDSVPIGSHDPSVAIAADGSVIYGIGDTWRLISSSGQVLDLAQEIIAEQPDMRQFIFGEMPGFVGGVGKLFIGADRAIYFQNDDFLNYRLSEMYLVAMQGGNEPEISPDPDGFPITLVYNEYGNPVEPYDPFTHLPIDLRYPLVVDYSFRPFSWDWWPEQKDGDKYYDHLVDKNGDRINDAHDADGNAYGWWWYYTEVFSPVWRLTSTQNGGYRFEPYGGSMLTNHRWLPDRAPAGFLFYDNLSEQNRYGWEHSGNIFLHVGAKVVQVNKDTGQILEANNPAARPFQVKSASGIVTDLRNAKSTDTHYYLLGRSMDDAQISLYRFDALTHTPVKLINGSEYEIYKFTVTVDNNVVFRGVRRSDGADIGGTIDLSGVITVIEAIQNRDIVQLERVL